MNRLGKVVSEKNGQATTTSRKVAKTFEKRHDHVLRDVENILQNSFLKFEESNSEISFPKFGEPNLITEFSRLNFELSNYKSRGKTYPEYTMTKDGFTLLVMGYSGEKAMRFKVEYIQKFNEMAEFIRSLQTAKLEFPALTNAIMKAHEEPKHYHFSNELNMINKIVLGMTARQFKDSKGLDYKKVKSIRPYLTTDQIKAIEELQRIDIGLIVAIKDFYQRKSILSDYLQKKLSIAS